MKFSLNNIFLIVSALTLLACGQNSGDTTTDAPAAKTEINPDTIAITPENVKQVLTDYAARHPDSIAVITTRHGTIKVRLYKETPMHRANFVRLAKSGFYDQGEFYRVVKGFAIQGGDSDNRTMRQTAYKIPQEFNRKYIHKKGALAMARYGDDRNPDKESSSHNFYIVQGEPVELYELREWERKHNITYTPEELKLYQTLGGEPSLDTEYTVFGEVIEGLDVVDKIAEERVGASSWPVQIVPHTIKVQ
ncbi:peptidylprolyl isomerase [Pontibacter sp. BT213]|uniref:peptidylprolyl isomerase n=1 Tax=Pontibacter fetidus TaxID=2700082 RepID=A0A6B2GYZ5_9BACT|nr:peptidylprolyl isomerase [Pontibacter fetidus]